MQHFHSEHLCEQLSAFLDGELPQAQIELLLLRLEREPELRAMLERYAVIGESVRGEPDRLTRGFCKRVAAEVAKEQEQKPQSAGRVSRRSSTPQWLRTAAGAAAGVGIAATVAAIAIFSLQRQQTPDAGTQMAAAAPGTAKSETEIIGDTSIRGDEALSYTVPTPATTHPVVSGARLADYVLAHSEYSSPLGRRNVLSGIIAEDPTPIDAAGAVQPRSKAQPRRPEAAPEIDEPSESGLGPQMNESLGPQMNESAGQQIHESGPLNDERGGPRWYFPSEL